MILSAIAAQLKQRSKADFKGRHYEALLNVQAVSWHLRQPPLRPAQFGLPSTDRAELPQDPVLPAPAAATPPASLPQRPAPPSPPSAPYPPAEFGRAEPPPRAVPAQPAPTIEPKVNDAPLNQLQAKAGEAITELERIGGVNVSPQVQTGGLDAAIAKACELLSTLTQVPGALASANGALGGIRGRATTFSSSFSDGVTPGAGGT